MAIDCRKKIAAGIENIFVLGGPPVFRNQHALGTYKIEQVVARSQFAPDNRSRLDRIPDLRILDLTSHECEKSVAKAWESNRICLIADLQLFARVRHDPDAF